MPPRRNLITLTQAADLLGIDKLDTAYRRIKRAGIEPVGRETGAAGQNLYRATDITPLGARRGRRAPGP